MKHGISAFFTFGWVLLGLCYFLQLGATIICTLWGISFFGLGVLGWILAAAVVPIIFIAVAGFFTMGLAGYIAPFFVIPYVGHMLFSNHGLRAEMATAEEIVMFYEGDIYDEVRGFGYDNDEIYSMLKSELEDLHVAYRSDNRANLDPDFTEESGRDEFEARWKVIVAWFDEHDYPAQQPPVEVTLPIYRSGVDLTISKFDDYPPLQNQWLD